ncbi:2-iminoacetate synthase ThiH [Heliobacterium gestii]|uniref:2-iminoacetate synthase ThiH n=1 Tax=Heliomicrobium gestii TaxID=2699 RepID=A0A845LEZ2_HELGE|nr:2-iminoacetate synthase ThiH [Heliomicrobium gestii]MBM7867488.1 2-iminoacetate synthase [Heliomicrobium gestii]MZP43964.1 2-iminoacetate synthase ThiH [Heliomicrobium gestii]
MHSFYEQIEAYEGFDFARFLEGVSLRQVDGVLNKDYLSPHDFLALLSPAAAERLEAMAQKAHRLTRQHFGRVIQLYTPIYLANYCVNRCVYCNFNHRNDIERRQLTTAEIEGEAEAIAATGLRQILLLTGEKPGKDALDYLINAVEIVRNHFTAVGIEVNPMDVAAYCRLAEAGVDSLTIYHETYDRAVYDRLHPAGPKKDYRWRLDAPERGCQAGFRAVNIGALLGLNHWPSEAFFTGLHASYLQNKYLGAEIGIAVPRIKAGPGAYQPESPVFDQDLVQILLAFRLFMPRAGISLSTREPAELRDHLLPLGITRMSAGSVTAVGGHIDENADDGQFRVSDERSVDAVREMLIAKGYQPVHQDWHRLA